MIALQDVSKTYTPVGQPAVPAVRHIDLEIARGEFVVITGRSGCGKTTLLSLVAGLTQPTSGRVLLDGQEVWRLPDKEQSLRRNAQLGFVFQFPSLLPTLTALENVMTPTLFSQPVRCGHALRSCWPKSAWTTSCRPFRANCRAGSSNGW
jgi:ABC-type lipoprotein export system ATPase subunit